MTFILHDQVRCWTIRDHVRSSPAVQQGEITTRASGTGTIRAVADVQSPDFLWHFCHEDNDFILFDMLLCFFTSVSKHCWSPCIWYRSVTVWNFRGKKSDRRIQHEFSDLPTWLKTPKQRPCVAEDEDETANQQKDMVSGYNGCMCFSGTLWGPSALNVKHEWNSRC